MSQAVFYGVFVYFWMKIRFFCSCCTISPQNVCSSCWQIIWLTSSCIHRIRSLVELCYYDAVQVPVLWPWELCVGTGKERPENPLSGKLRRQVSDQGRTDFSVSDTNLPGSLSSAGNSLTWPLLTNPGWWLHAGYNPALLAWLANVFTYHRKTHWETIIYNMYI